MVFKTALFSVDMAVPGLIKIDRTLPHDPEEKKTLSADVPDRKHEKLTMSQTGIPEAKLNASS